MGMGFEGKKCAPTCCAGQMQAEADSEVTAEGRFPIAQIARGISASNLPMILL